MRDPTFWPLGLRGRTAVELGVLAVLTGLYLHLWPHRPPGVDPGLALVGLGLVALGGRQTTRRVWGAPAGPPLDRLRRGFMAMTWFTAPVLLAFAVYGGWDAYSARGQWPDVFLRLFAPRFFLTFAVYVPWALVQQTLFQGYLLARLKALAPSASPIALAAVNGLLYGAVHVPHWDVALVTVAAGLVWTFAYQRTRSVVPIAVSHAVLGSAYFYWVRDTDAVRIFRLALATPLGWS